MIMPLHHCRLRQGGLRPRGRAGGIIHMVNGTQGRAPSHPEPPPYPALAMRALGGSGLARGDTLRPNGPAGPTPLNAEDTHLLDVQEAQL